jgi:hypothetical protein
MVAMTSNFPASTSVLIALAMATASTLAVSFKIISASIGLFRRWRPEIDCPFCEFWRRTTINTSSESNVPLAATIARNATPSLIALIVGSDAVARSMLIAIVTTTTTVSTSVSTNSGMTGVMAVMVVVVTVSGTAAAAQPYPVHPVAQLAPAHPAAQ